MVIPKDLAVFHLAGMAFGTTATLIAIQSLKNSAAWNKCAPTLNVNHCPWQPPERLRRCEMLKEQLDSKALSDLQKIKRLAPEELYYMVTMIVGICTSSVAFILYFFLPLYGQLCLGKAVSIFACFTYALGEFWNVQTMLHYNKQAKGSYGERLCNLASDAPLKDIGSKNIAKCFKGYKFCQDPILGFVGCGLAGISILFHGLALFSAVWECRTQVEPLDWGTNENLPREMLIVRPAPPKYVR